MEFYENKSLKRCFDIVREYGGIDEYLKRIEETVNDSYTKEQCYKDILENADFNFTAVQKFIKHIILSEKKEDIDIIMQNLGMLDAELLSELILYLKKDDKCKEFLKNEIRKGLISTQDSTRKAFMIYRFLKFEDDGKQIAQERFEDFIYAGCDFRLINQILEEMEIPEERVLSNKTKVLQNTKGESIVSFIKWFNERGAFNDNDVSLEDFVKALHSDIKDKTTIKMLEIIYKELMDKQNLSIKDIELLGRGTYSNNYKIGQFILKIGEPRQTKQIPYHRRILQPIIRQDISHFNEKNLYIEIQNEVYSKWYDGMNEQQIEEELYKIYKEMRAEGVVWTDIKKENVGRLIRANKTNYYTETLEGDFKEPETLKITQKELDVSDNSVGIFDRREEECMQPGELVILDTDYIFKEEDIDLEEEMQERQPAKYTRYEERYRYELEQEKEQR